MSRPKLKRFSFIIPITKINKSDGLFSVQNAGELLVTATARISGSLEDLPIDFAESGEVKIFIESVKYCDVDILPVLNLPEARPLMISINRAAYNSLSSILKSE